MPSVFQVAHSPYWLQLFIPSCPKVITTDSNWHRLNEGWQLDDCGSNKFWQGTAVLWLYRNPPYWSHKIFWCYCKISLWTSLRFSSVRIKIEPNTKTKSCLVPVQCLCVSTGVVSQCFGTVPVLCPDLYLASVSLLTAVRFWLGSAKYCTSARTVEPTQGSGIGTNLVPKITSDNCPHRNDWNYFWWWQTHYKRCNDYSLWRIIFCWSWLKFIFFNFNSSK